MDHAMQPDANAFSPHPLWRVEYSGPTAGLLPSCVITLNLSSLLEKENRAADTKRIDIMPVLEAPKTKYR